MIRRFVDDKITYINSDFRWKGSDNVVKFCVLIGNFASEKLRFYLSKPYLRIGGPEWRKFQSYSSDVGDAVTGQTAEYGSFRQDLGCAKDQNLGAGAQKWSGAPGKVFQVRQNIFKCA